MIAEELRSHKCEIQTMGAKTIWLDWISDGFTDKNNDYVRNAKGLDGVLYGLIVCKHNPPHNTQKRWFDDKRDLLIAILLTTLVVSQSFAFAHAMTPNEISHTHAPNIKVTLP